MMSQNTNGNWYGLNEPLPDGATRRKKTRTETDEFNDDGKLNRSRKKQKPEQLPESITAKFDGGARGNGSSSAVCAFGCFVHSYECHLSRGNLIPNDDCTTNNAAELIAATQLANGVGSAAEWLRDSGVKRVHFVGDSLHVIGTITSGALHSYVERKEFANSLLWRRLSEALRNLHDMFEEFGITYEWSWIPRWLNVEPDELANAAMDHRPADTSVLSRPCSAIDLRHDLSLLIRLLPRRRLRLIRTLPDSLQETFSVLCAELAAKHESLFVDLFLVLPVLLAIAVSRIDSKQSYKRLRDHITLLSNAQYLHEQIAVAIVACTTTRHPTHSSTTTTAAHKLRTMCKRGLHSKVLSQACSGSSVADVHDVSVQQQLRDMFPQSTTMPTPLPKFEVKIGFNDILRALTKTSKGTAPGMTGWTRELLHAAMSFPTPTLTDAITAVFSKIVNADLNDDQFQLLCSGILIPLMQPGKLKPRPVNVTDLCMRLSVRIALSIARASGSKQIGECVRIIRELQAALDAGGSVIVSDGSNAFNCLFREPAFAFLRAHQEQFAPVNNLFNMLYAHVTFVRLFDSQGNTLLEIPITLGTRQGCVSGTFFMEIATDAAAQCAREKIRPHQLFKFVDDIDIASSSPGQSRSLFTAQQHVNVIFKEMCNLDLSGPKLLVITDDKASFSNFDITAVSAGKALGGLITSKRALKTEIAAHLHRVDTKALHRLLVIRNLQLPIQDKLFLVRFASQWLAYYIATFPFQHAESLWVHLDEQHHNAAEFLLQVRFSGNHALIPTTPTIKGGLGILGLQRSAKHISNIKFTTMTRFYAELNKSQNAMTTIVPFRRCNFSDSWPTTSFTTLSDLEVRSYWRIRTNGFEKPPNFTCALMERSTGHADNFAHHLLCCSRCCPEAMHLRHETLLWTLINTLKHCGIYARKMKQDEHPLPDNVKGGADFALFTPFLHEEVDITIVTQPLDHHRDAMQTAAWAKKRKYAEYKKLVNFVVSSFVMDTNCSFHADTLQRIDDWASHHHSTSKIAAALYSHSQFAVIRAMTISLSSFYHKHGSSPSTPLADQLT